MDCYELKEAIKKVKSQITPSEIMTKYFAGEEVEHIPFNFIMVPESLCGIYGYTTSEMNVDFEIYAEVIERGLNDFYIDGISVGLGLRTLGAAMGSTIYCPKHGVENIEDHILKDYDDWDKMIDPDPYNNRILTQIFENTAKIKERFPKVNITLNVTGPISTAIGIRPVEKVLKDTRRNPEKLKELIALCTDKSLRWVEAFIKEFGPTTAFIADPVTCTDILSIKQFEEFSFPELKRLVLGLKGITGSKPYLHICGHTKGLWSYLRELDISLFSVDNCEDLAEVCKRLGDKFTIMGNIPPVDVLRMGSIDDVIESVKDCIKKGSASANGYILSSGCDVPIGTPKENLEAYLYAAMTYGKNAKIGQLPKGLDVD